MAKAKRRKTTKNKKDENEILLYVYALITIGISIIGSLQIGFVGEIVMGIVMFIFGKLYGLVFGATILYSICIMLKKTPHDIPIKYITAIIALLLALLLASSIPQNTTLHGIQIISQYIKNAGSIFHGEIAAGGGILGAFIISIFTFLFDYTGTWIIIMILFILGCILLLSGAVMEWLSETKEKIKEPILEANEESKRKRKERQIAKQEKKLQKEKERQEAKQKQEEESFVQPKMANILADEQEEDVELYRPKSLLERIVLDKEEIEEEFQICAPLIGKTLTKDNSFDENAETQSSIFIDADDTNSFVVDHFDEPKDFVETEKITTASENLHVEENSIENKDSFVSKFVTDFSEYKLPSIHLLQENKKKGKSTLNMTQANENGKRLIEILHQFGVKATLIATHIGPSVTKFEVKPDLGVRVSKISNLQHDIKMALAAKDIRIEAPIPGKSAVGIEVPNSEKTSVYMKDLMKSIPKQFDNKMLFVLGKDLLGNCVYAEMNKMPHLLIAGATGSGKSVCVNTIITSFLMRTKPDEVKLLLIDPKKVEFTPYREIPHLLGPVITDGDEANRALKVIVKMMDDRYELFSTVGVRNIQGYNKYILNHPEEQLKPLPWIVVIVDELADLMLVAAKEVESSIQRITQLARAAGIHLIVATQRPSVDVITGIIKANIPSRIAFAVSSAVDSRTILDQVGAEKLLGYGDMLYIPVGDQVATRVQGAFVSDEEVSAICNFVSAQAKPKFEDAFLRLEALDSGKDISSSVSLQEDPIYEEVREFVISTQKASTSFIQRKFSIGYARAARLVDVLEERGVIGPARGSKPREVYIRADEGEC